MKIMLREKFLIPTILFILICIAILGYQSYRTSAEVLQDKIREDLEQISSLLDKQVNLWVSGIEATATAQATREQLRKLLENPNPTPKDVAHVNDALNEAIKSYSDYEGLNLLDKDGVIIASSNPSNIGMDLSSRQFVKDSKSSGKTVISDVLASKKDGSPVFLCITPVKIDGKTNGFVTAVINCTLFSDKFITPIKIGKNGYAFVADNKGTVFAHPNKSLVMKNNINDFAWGKDIFETEKGVEYYSTGDQEKMTAYNIEKLTGWAILVCASINDINEGVAVIRNTALIGGIIVVVLLGIGLTYLLTKLVIVPVKVIMDFLQRTSLGDTSTSKQYAKDLLKMYKRKDEVGNMTLAAGSLRIYLDKKAREAQTIASGDFTANVAIASKDDTLGRSFTDMKERLNKTLTTMSALIDQVTNGSNQFAAASQSLSSGATQTAASLEEINSSIMDIGSQTKLNAENATTANTLASGSRHTADKGNSDVEEMVVAMVDMQESGQEIAKIVKMIDDIAFQTNLLSLNAAVEAARAGHHGKGFAVVAEEVRNLAGRSAKAAKETADLVDQTVSKLSNGADIAHSTQDSLGSVVVDVVKVADILGEISTASTEQAEGIAQISIGLQQIDQVTQQNTANAEETSAAAISMSAQAQELTNLMSQFKLEQNNLDSLDMTNENTPNKNRKLLDHNNG